VKTAPPAAAVSVGVSGDATTASFVWSSDARSGIERSARAFAGVIGGSSASWDIVTGSS
jgi:hypothetical protein